MALYILLNLISKKRKKRKEKEIWGEGSFFVNEFHNCKRVFSKSGELYSLIGMSSNNAVKIIYWINYYVTASLAWQKLSVTIIFEMGMHFNSMI